MFRFFKETYLTEFALFFRAGGEWWTLGINAGKGAAGVTLFECIILVGIEAWIEMLIGKRFHLDFYQWAIWIAVFVLYFANYYVLVTRGHGIRFEREFNNLEKPRRILLRASCRVMELATVAFILCSIYAYHHFFHIIPKSGFE